MGSTRWRPRTILGRMRSRPLVKVRTSAAVLEPGMPFEVEVELVSRSETPTDSVVVRFDASELSVYGAGKGARVHSRIWESQAATWKAGKLGIGSKKQRFAFHVPEGAPPTYSGTRCVTEYRLHVTVDIPWWANREASFVLPVAAAPTPLRPASPLIVATSSEGPRPGQLYIEASIDATELAPGDVLTGVVSFANVNAKRVRAIRIGFVSQERVKLPAAQIEDAMVYATTLLSGPPPDEEPVPFRIALPPGVTPSFSSRPFSFGWRFEIRADVALGTDEVLSVPIEVRRPPPNVPRPPRPGRTWSVGRDRLRAVWQQVAARVAMELDASGTSLRAARGPLTLVMHREAIEGRLGVVAGFAWPHLGLDLRLVERSWTHVFASDAVRLSNPAADPRFVAFGREAAQSAPFLDPEMLQLMLTAASVKLDDDGAVFGVPSGATTAPCSASRPEQRRRRRSSESRARAFACSSCSRPRARGSVRRPRWPRTSTRGARTPTAWAVGSSSVACGSTTRTSRASASSWARRGSPAASSTAPSCASPSIRRWRKSSASTIRRSLRWRAS